MVAVRRKVILAVSVWAEVPEISEVTTALSNMFLTTYICALLAVLVIITSKPQVPVALVARVWVKSEVLFGNSKKIDLALTVLAFVPQQVILIALPLAENVFAGRVKVIKPLLPEPTVATAVTLLESTPISVAPVPLVPELTVEELTIVASVGLVPNTNAPLPVSSVIAAAKFAELGVTSQVATPVPIPVIPVTGTAVAVIVPEPEVVSDAPVPTTIAAVVFVLEVKALKAEDPPPVYCGILRVLPV